MFRLAANPLFLYCLLMGRSGHTSVSRVRSITVVFPAIVRKPLLYLELARRIYTGSRSVIVLPSSAYPG